MKFWRFIENKATETEPESIELRIEGDIVDNGDAWIYEWFGEPAAAPNSFRQELSNYKGKDLTVWIDSYGGSAFAGAGIYTALKEHKGKVTVKVDGKAMSAASVIAMAGDEVLMSPVAVMMIHNPLTGVEGDMHRLRKVADTLDEVKDSIINAYVLKTGKSKEEVSALMDEEFYMSANTALKNKFIDGVLYQDQPLNVENMSGISLNRLSVVSNAKQSVERAINLFKPDETEDLELELNLI